MTNLFENISELDDNFNLLTGIEAVKLRIKRIASRVEGDTPYSKDGVPIKNFSYSGANAVAGYLEERLRVAGITVKVSVTQTGRVSVFNGVVKLYDSEGS